MQDSVDTLPVERPPVGKFDAIFKKRITLFGAEMEALPIYIGLGCLSAVAVTSLFLTFSGRVVNAGVKKEQPAIANPARTENASQPVAATQTLETPDQSVPPGIAVPQATPVASPSPAPIQSDLFVMNKNPKQSATRLYRNATTFEQAIDNVPNGTRVVQHAKVKEWSAVTTINDQGKASQIGWLQTEHIIQGKLSQ